MPFALSPLLCHSVSRPLATRVVSRVIISTDDISCAALARAEGADVRFPRPIELAADDSSSEPAFLHALKLPKEYKGYKPDMFVFVQSVSLLTFPKDIDACFELLLEENADIVLSATPSHAFLGKNVSTSAQVINRDKAHRQQRYQMEQDYRETGGAICKPVLRV